MQPLPTLAAVLTLALAGGASAQANPAAPVTVAIVMTSYQYSPEPITLQAGQPVRLLFQNKAGKSHDFTAPAFFAASRVLAGKVQGGKVNLKAGETRTVDLIPAKGTYPVHCGKFMHSTLGMKARVVVQ